MRNIYCIVRYLLINSALTPVNSQYVYNPLAMKKYFYIVVGLLTLSSCKDHDNLWQESAEAETIELHRCMSLKLLPDIVQEIDNKSRTLSIPTGSDELDEFLTSVGATQLSRIFPYAGRDEQKQQQEGLNLWYTLRCDLEGGATRTAAKSSLAGIASYAEPAVSPQMERVRYVEVAEPAETRAASASDYMYDDPLYPRQWDLRNDGTVGMVKEADGSTYSSSIAGADISAEAAWRITTGDPDVVVAIVDGGIDLTHPDLQGSLWTNPGEIPGNGIDDDDNGYIDDYYGYNFVDDCGIISPTRHGTHVAGTIAARNNNGRGVCGIAGGDGTAKTGVRVMCCQIFKNNPDYDPTDLTSSETVGTGDRNMDAAAIVYGANNGAVISQNSWGYGYGATPEVIREAIAYYVQYAGGNKTARPLMQGGIAIFAAGNDGSGYSYWPAAQPDVISVAACGPDYQAAWYTNYGANIDIVAPGGTQPVGKLYPYEEGLPTSACLNTVPLNDEGRGGYAYMQGTSMACPHVSGIAALIVSRYGGANFTAAELRQRLLSGVKPIDYNKLVEVDYRNGLGMGYADAAIALSDFDLDLTPSAPVFVEDSIQAGYGSITLGWTSNGSGSDGSLQYYTLYWSDQPLTLSNLTEAQHQNFLASFAEAGQVFVHTQTGLASNSTRYYAVQAVARNGQASQPILLSHPVSTLDNTAPHIHCDMQGNLITLAGRDTCTIWFDITDDEGHDWTYDTKTYDTNLIGGIHLGGIHHERIGNRIALYINVEYFTPDIYHYELYVIDEYRAWSKFSFTLEIENDHAPLLFAPSQKLVIRKGEEMQLSLTDMTVDEAPSSVLYDVKHGEGISTSIDGTLLNIRAKRWGESYIEITATDKHRQTNELRIPVFVYENEGIYALYPTMATTTLYVMVGDVIKGDVTISVCNSAGKECLHETFNTSILNVITRTFMLAVWDLAPGTYTLTLSNQGKTYQERFVKK